MVKLSELRSVDDVHAEDLADPEVRAEHERTALGRAVALEVLRYRTEHGLSQSALARHLGMQQPAIARLEAGDHEPTFATLQRLARGLGMAFHIEITPKASGLRDSA